MTRGRRSRLTILLILAIALSAVTTLDIAALADDESALGQGGGSLILVLDGSGSMKESDGGRTRMDSAKTSLRKVIGQLPADSKVGLRVYGSKIAAGAGSCKDTTLLVPVDDVDKAKLKAGVDKLKPLGNTPIGYSLQQAYKDLPKEGPRSIVLVSDGEENCGVPPCKVARDLKRKGADFYVDVVGLQVNEKSRDQLICIASAGGGTYYDVSDISELASTLTRTSVRAARGYHEAGLPVEGATSASSTAPMLDDGRWLDTVGDSGTEFYTLPDPGKGTFHVSASTRTTSPDLSDTESLKVAVTSADGTACGEPVLATVQGVVNQKAPYAAALDSTPDDRKDCGEGPYVLSIEPPGVGGIKPLEVLVRTEPAVENADGLPGAAPSSGYSDDTAAENAPSGTAVSAIGSPSFAGAPPVAPGVYSDSILPGETLLYRIPDVAWGQQPVCDLTLKPTATAGAALKSAGFFEVGKVELYGPTKALLTDPTAVKKRVQYGGDAEQALHVAGPPVRYLNRISNDLVLQGASLDGDYYCALTLFTSTKSVDDKVGEVPFTLVVALNGQAGKGKPTYASNPNPNPNPNPKPTADDKKPTAADHSGNGSLPWLIVGAVVLLVLLAAFWVLLRRRRSGEDRPTP